MIMVGDLARYHCHPDKMTTAGARVHPSLGPPRRRKPDCHDNDEHCPIFPIMTQGQRTLVHYAVSCEGKGKGFYFSRNSNGQNCPVIYYYGDDGGCTGAIFTFTYSVS